MKREHLVKIHVIATMVAFFTILTFLLSSLIAELRGDTELIRQVKSGILYALPVLLLAMPTLALTGKQLAKGSNSPVVRRKMRRMKGVMINGLMLVSLAVFLYVRAQHWRIDTIFLYAQGAELLFGGVNLLLIGLNIRDGLRLSRQSYRAKLRYKS